VIHNAIETSQYYCDPFIFTPFSLGSIVGTAA